MTPIKELDPGGLAFLAARFGKRRADVETKILHRGVLATMTIFSPLAWRSASSGERATLTVIVHSTSGWRWTGTVMEADRLDRRAEHDLFAPDR